MKHSFSTLIAVLSLFVVVATPAFARGGGVPNLLNSPGYQRALEESRKRYREQLSQPSPQAPAAASRKKSKHRGHH